MTTIKEITESLISSESTKLTKQQVSDYRIYVVTWNVGSNFPDNISLRNLLNLQKNDLGEIIRKDLPDIYAIGLQEVNVEVKQQMRNMFCLDPWTEKTNVLLHALDYVTVQTEQMQGLLLTIYVKREHVPHLRDIEAEYTRTGFGGIWGNKGAVSIRFNLYGCGLVFVEAHLAAHDRHLDERIEDYKQILDKHHYHVSRYREINDHDYVWWFGDLNFRLHGKDSAEDVRDAVFRGDIKELLERDQLNYVRLVKQSAFQLLHETLPTFPPTFKFKEGTSEYDMKRRPAWTDRILYAMQPINRQPNMPLDIKQHTYNSHTDYMISDHRPVSSEFTIKLFHNYRYACVAFTPLQIWNLGEENTLVYTKPAEFVEYKHDWVGIFRVNFSSLRDYVGYEYVCKSESSSSSSGNEQWIPGQEVPNLYRLRPHRRHHNKAHYVRRERVADTEQVQLDFASDLELIDGELYKFIYFQSSTGIRGISGVAGMSNEFRAVKAPRSTS